MRHDVVKELSTVGKLHDEIDLLGRVHHLVQMHDILVGDALENQDLPADPLDVGDLNDAMLFQNLHSDLLARQNVRPELDLAEGPLPNGLAQQVVADGLALLRAGLARAAAGGGVSSRSSGCHAESVPPLPALESQSGNKSQREKPHLLLTRAMAD